MKYLILKRDNVYFNVNENNEISYNDINPSLNWIFDGAVRINNFGHIVKRFSADFIRQNANGLDWLHKNGKQRLFLCDIDHGTYRIWITGNQCAFISDNP